MFAWFHKLTEILWSFFAMIVDWLLVPAELLIQGVKAAFPQYTPALEQFRYILEYVNAYADVNALCAFFVVWAEFHLVVISYRFIKSWIPSVSG